MNSLNISGYVRQALAQLSTEAGGFSEIEKGELLSLAVARAISSRLLLPSTPAGSAEAYFASTHDSLVCELISRINESVYINTRQTRDLTFKFFELRYNLVFNYQVLGNMIPLLAASSPEFFSPSVGDLLRRESVLKGEGNFKFVFDNIVEEVRSQIDTPEDAPAPESTVSPRY